MPNASAQLIGIRYSPWTEKARWALDHHGLPYDYHEHLIIFGLPELRWRTGRWRGALTVPAYREGRGPTLMDSWDIALHADRQGQGSPLFTPETLPRIQKYNELSERALGQLRIWVSSRLLESPQAQVEVLPSFIPQPLRRMFSFLARVGVAYIGREFGYRPSDRNRALAELHAIWSELRRDLEASGGQYLIGTQLSYADIAMVATLQGLRPAALGPYLSPAYRECWSVPELQDEFRGLLEWRDRILTQHRNQPQTRTPQLIQ